MVLNKKTIQKEVEETLKLGKYTEGLGEIILLFADVSVYKRGLLFRHNEFEIDFIIKPRIVDMLLLKVFKYNKEYASAYTFFSMVTSTAIIDAIKDIRKAEKGISTNIYYIEDIKSELKNMVEEDYDYLTSGVYLNVDGNIINLK